MSSLHVVAHASDDPSANKLKCMGDELSALPATGSTRREGVSAPGVINESTSTTHADANVLGNERDISNLCRRGIDALPLSR